MHRLDGLVRCTMFVGRNTHDLLDCSQDRVFGPAQWDIYR